MRLCRRKCSTTVSRTTGRYLKQFQQVSATHIIISSSGSMVFFQIFSISTPTTAYCWQRVLCCFLLYRCWYFLLQVLSSAFVKAKQKRTIGFIFHHCSCF